MEFWPECSCLVSIPTRVTVERHELRSRGFRVSAVRATTSGPPPRCVSWVAHVCTPVLVSLPPAGPVAPFALPPLPCSSATAPVLESSPFLGHLRDPGLLPGTPAAEHLPRPTGSASAPRPPACVTKTPEGEAVRGTEAVDRVEFYLFFKVCFASTSVGL